MEEESQRGIETELIGGRQEDVLELTNNTTSESVTSPAIPFTHVPAYEGITGGGGQPNVDELIERLVELEREKWRILVTRSLSTTSSSDQQPVGSSPGATPSVPPAVLSQLENKLQSLQQDIRVMTGRTHSPVTSKGQHHNHHRPSTGIATNEDEDSDGIDDKAMVPLDEDDLVGDVVRRPEDEEEEEALRGERVFTATKDSDDDEGESEEDEDETEEESGLRTHMLRLLDHQHQQQQKARGGRNQSKGGLKGVGKKHSNKSTTPSSSAKTQPAPVTRPLYALPHTLNYGLLFERDRETSHERDSGHGLSPEKDLPLPQKAKQRASSILQVTNQMVHANSIQSSAVNTPGSGGREKGKENGKEREKERVRDSDDDSESKDSHDGDDEDASESYSVRSSATGSHYAPRQPSKAFKLNKKANKGQRDSDDDRSPYDSGSESNPSSTEEHGNEIEDDMIEPWHRRIRNGNNNNNNLALEFCIIEADWLSLSHYQQLLTPLVSSRMIWRYPSPNGIDDDSVSNTRTVQDQNFFFPSGVKVELVSNAVQEVKTRLYNYKRHIVPFSDPKGKPLYACCLTIVQAYSLQEIDEMENEHHEDGTQGTRGTLTTTHNTTYKHGTVANGTLTNGTSAHIQGHGMIIYNLVRQYRAKYAAKCIQKTFREYVEYKKKKAWKMGGIVGTTSTTTLQSPTSKGKSSSMFGSPIPHGKGGTAGAGTASVASTGSSTGTGSTHGTTVTPQRPGLFSRMFRRTGTTTTVDHASGLSGDAHSTTVTPAVSAGASEKVNTSTSASAASSTTVSANTSAHAIPPTTTSAKPDSKSTEHVKQATHDSTTAMATVPPATATQAHPTPAPAPVPAPSRFASFFGSSRHAANPAPAATTTGNAAVSDATPSTPVKDSNPVIDHPITLREDIEQALLDESGKFSDLIPEGDRDDDSSPGASASPVSIPNHSTSGAEGEAEMQAEIERERGMMTESVEESCKSERMDLELSSTRTVFPVLEDESERTLSDVPINEELGMTVEEEEVKKEPQTPEQAYLSKFNFSDKVVIGQKVYCIISPTPEYTFIFTVLDAIAEAEFHLAERQKSFPPNPTISSSPLVPHSEPSTTTVTDDTPVVVDRESEGKERESQEGMGEKLSATVESSVEGEGVGGSEVEGALTAESVVSPPTKPPKPTNPTAALKPVAIDTLAPPPKPPRTRWTAATSTGVAGLSLPVKLPPKSRRRYTADEISGLRACFLSQVEAYIEDYLSHVSCHLQDLSNNFSVARGGRGREKNTEGESKGGSWFARGGGTGGSLVRASDRLGTRNRILEKFLGREIRGGDGGNGVKLVRKSSGGAGGIGGGKGGKEGERQGGGGGGVGEKDKRRKSNVKNDKDNEGVIDRGRSDSVSVMSIYSWSEDTDVRSVSAHSASHSNVISHSNSVTSLMALNGGSVSSHSLSSSSPSLSPLVSPAKPIVGVSGTSGTGSSNTASLLSSLSLSHSQRTNSIPGMPVSINGREKEKEIEREINNGKENEKENEIKRETKKKGKRALVSPQIITSSSDRCVIHVPHYLTLTPTPTISTNSTTPSNMILSPTLTIDMSRLLSTRDWSCAVLFTHLNATTIFKIINLLLMEKSLVIYGKHPGVVTACTMGVINLLSPFVWEGIFVPLLPDGARALFEAPVPLIVGTVSPPKPSDVSIETAILHLNDDNAQVRYLQPLSMSNSISYPVSHNPSHTTTLSSIPTANDSTVGLTVKRGLTPKHLQPQNLLLNQSLPLPNSLTISSPLPTTNSTTISSAISSSGGRERDDGIGIGGIAEIITESPSSSNVSCNSHSPSPLPISSSPSLSPIPVTPDVQVEKEVEKEREREKIMMKEKEREIEVKHIEFLAWFVRLPEVSADMPVEEEISKRLEHTRRLLCHFIRDKIHIVHNLAYSTSSTATSSSKVGITMQVTTPPNSSGERVIEQTVKVRNSLDRVLMSHLPDAITLQLRVLLSAIKRHNYSFCSKLVDDASAWKRFIRRRKPQSSDVNGSIIPPSASLDDEDFIAEQFLEPLRYILEFQEAMVKTQLFVSFMDRLRKEHYMLDQVREFIGHWIYFHVVRRRRSKLLSKKHKRNLLSRHHSLTPSNGLIVLNAVTGTENVRSGLRKASFHYPSK